jgi:hypothetical protein
MTCERTELNARQKADQTENTQDKLIADAAISGTRRVLNQFGSIDKDKNGFITLSEIDTMPDKKLAEALKGSHASIQTANDDEWFFENDGITRGDLQKFSAWAAEMPEATRKARDVRETVERNWSSLAGSDQRIRRHELARAADSGMFNQCDSEALRNGENDFTGIGHKVGKNSRKIKFPHLEERVREIESAYSPIRKFGNALSQDKPSW